MGGQTEHSEGDPGMGDGRVTVHVGEDGSLVSLEVEGDIDRDNLTEERAPTPPAHPAADDQPGQALRWFG